MLRLITLRFLETIFRNYRLYILILGVALLAAPAIFFLIPPNYQLRGTVYVQRDSLLTSLSDLTQVTQYTSPSQATLSEVVSLIYTDSFAIDVLKETSLRNNVLAEGRFRERALRDYRDAMMVMAEGVNIVVFVATHPDPVLAQQMVNETMNAYVDWRMTFERTDSEVARDFFADLIVRYEEDLARAERALFDYLLLYPDPIRGARPSEEVFEINRLQSLVAQAANRLADAKDKEENARLSLAKVNSEALQRYLVIDSPSIPTQPPSLLRRAVFVFGGFLAGGFFLILAHIALLMLFDRGLYFPTDVQYGLNSPTLAMVPLIQHRSPGNMRVSSSPRSDPGATGAAGAVSPVKS